MKVGQFPSLIRILGFGSLMVVLSVSACTGIDDMPSVQTVVPEKSYSTGEIDFEWYRFNRHPIENLKELGGGFVIDRGNLLSADGTIVRAHPDVYEALRSQELLPQHSSGPLMEWSIDALDEYSYFDGDGMVSGICCLSIMSLHQFSYAETDYLLASFGKPTDPAYFPSWGQWYDSALILYRMEGRSLTPLIATQEGGEDVELAFGDLDQNGRLDFIHRSIEDWERLVLAYELNPFTDRFEPTGKFLKSRFNGEGIQLIDCDSSKWY